MTSPHQIIACYSLSFFFFFFHFSFLLALYFASAKRNSREDITDDKGAPQNVLYLKKLKEDFPQRIHQL